MAKAQITTTIITYNILRKVICAIANLDLTDVQWLQASVLPVEDGRLAVGHVSSLAPSIGRGYRHTPAKDSTSQSGCSDQRYSSSLYQARCLVFRL